MKNLSDLALGARIWRSAALFGIFVFMLWTGADSLAAVARCADTSVLGTDMLIASIAVPLAVAYFWRRPQ